MFWRERRWQMFLIELVFDTLGLSYLFGAQTILPYLQDEFAVSRAAAAWVSISFSLGTAATILPAAFLANALGRRPVLIAGLLLEGSALATMAFAPTFALVLALSVALGVGNAVRAASMMAMVQGQFPAAQRGRTIGLMLAGWGVGQLAAAPVAGFLADQYGWRSLYLANVPVWLFGVAGAVLVFRDIPGERRERPAIRRFNYAGMGWLALSITALLVALQRSFVSGSAPVAAALAGVALVAGWRYLASERSASYPLLDLLLFRSPAFVLGAGLALLFALAASATTFLFPFFLIQGLGWTGSTVGAVLIWFSITRPFVTPLSGRLADRFGSGRLLLAATVITAAGGSLALLLRDSPSFPLVAAVLFVSGLGQALFQAPNQKQLYDSVPAAKLSIAPGMLLLGGQGGRAIGAALAAALLSVAPSGANLAGAFALSIVVVTALFTALSGALFCYASGRRRSAALPAAERV